MSLPVASRAESSRRTTRQCSVRLPLAAAEPNEIVIWPLVRLCGLAQRASVYLTSVEVAAAGAAAEAVMLPAVPGGATMPPAPAGRQRVLIIDDEERIREVLVRILHRRDIDADAFDAGVEHAGKKQILLESRLVQGLSLGQNTRS